MLAVLGNLNFHSKDISWEGISEAITELVVAEQLNSLTPDEHLDQLMKILIDVAYASMCHVMQDISKKWLTYKDSQTSQDSYEETSKTF